MNRPLTPWRRFLAAFLAAWTCALSPLGAAERALGTLAPQGAAVPLALPRSAVGLPGGLALPAGLDTRTGLPALPALPASPQALAPAWGSVQPSLLGPALPALPPRSVAAPAPSSFLPAAPPNARVLAPAQLDAAQAAAAPAFESPQAASPEGALGAKASMDSFWEGFPQRAAEDTVLPLSEPDTALALGRGSSTSRETQASVPSPSAGHAALFAGAATFPWRIPELSLWLRGAWETVTPYVAAGGVLAGTWAANRVVRWGVEKVADLAKWKPNTKVAVRMVSSIGVWTGGVSLALHTAGASTSALVTTFGLGGVGVTMAIKDFIGNLIEGVKVLVNQPFIMGDKIQVGEESYVVKDMDLRYVLLEPAGLSHSLTHMTYVELAGSAITVFRPYSNKHKLDFKKRGLSLAALLKFPFQLLGFTRHMPPHQLRNASLWFALGVGLLVGLPFLKAWLAWGLLNSVFPYLEAAAVIFATRSIERLLAAFVTRTAEKRGWNLQATLVMKLIAEVLSYALGGSIALRTVGLTWTTVLATLGATSAALGWASADILGNLFHGAWLLIKQPFKIGDTIQVADKIGQVVDMTTQYVVLDPGDGVHVLVPQSVLKAKSFTPLDARDLPAAKAKLEAAKKK